MEFVLRQQEFRKLIDSVIPAVSNSVEIPVFGCLKIDASNGGVTIHGMDSRISMRSVVQAAVKRPGIAVVAGKALSDLVRLLLPDSSVSVRMVGETRLQVVSGRSTMHLNTLTVDNFPTVPAYDAKCFVTTDGFFSDLKKVGFAASREDGRPVLQGVLVKNGEIVAVDGHRMAIKKIPYSLPDPIIIPASAIDRISKVFDNEQLGIAVDGTSVFFKQGVNDASARLLEGQFPNYMAVIPKDSFTVAQVKRADLIYALKVVGLAADRLNTVLLSFNDGVLHLTAECPEIGRAEEKIECAFKGSCSMGVNAQYVSQAIERMQAEVISFEIRSELKPLLLREDGYLHVIMPKRV